MKERGPIFYDAERVRWGRTRRVMEITGALLTLLLAYFFVTIAISVELPAGLLPDAKPAYRALKSKKKPVPAREGQHRRVANIGTVPASYDPLRAAFFVSWDANSLASLKKHYKDIDLLIPEQLHAVTPDGALTVVDYEHGQNTVKASPAEAIALLRDDKLHQWMKSFNPPIELPMMGLVNNYDGVEWRIKEMVQMLATPAARQNLVRGIVEYAVESHEAGIVVDFEEVPDASQAHFRAFIGGLAPAMHSVGLKLMIALPARDDVYDYEYFGKQCDAIVLMNYDLKICVRYSTMFPRRRSSSESRIMLTTGPRLPRSNMQRQRSSASRKRCCTSRNRRRTSSLIATRSTRTIRITTSTTMCIRCGCWTPSRRTTNCAPARGSEFRARRYGGWDARTLRCGRFGMPRTQTPPPGKN